MVYFCLTIKCFRENLVNVGCREIWERTVWAFHQPKVRLIAKHKIKFSTNVFTA